MESGWQHKNEMIHPGECGHGVKSEDAGGRGFELSNGGL
jgi:hypothetical protein